MKGEHFHIYLLTDCTLSSVNCLSKSTGSWLSGEISQRWDRCPWDTVGPLSLEASKGQARQTLNEGGFKEIQVAAVGSI